MTSALDALLDGYAGVVAGDRVVVVAGGRDPVEPALVAALAEAASRRGATVERLDVPPFDPRTSDAPVELAAALDRADVLLDLAGLESLVHTEAGRRAVRERGLRMVSVSLRTLDEADTPFARFPLDRLFHRARSAAARIAPGGLGRLTAENGTDLRFRVRPGSVLGMPGGAQPAPLARGRGGFGLFPAGAVGTSPEGAEGVLVLDGLVGFRGALPEPIRCEVRDGRVRSAQGGAAGAWLSERIAAHDEGGFVAKLLVGLNPRAPVAAGLRELDRRKARLSRAEGVVLVGLGDARAIGGEVASTWHWDGVVLPPLDVTIDGRPLVAAGAFCAGLEAVPLDDGATLLPHEPRLIARAGDLAFLRVNPRGRMEHAHRNPESDEVWVPLDDATLWARLEAPHGDLEIRPGQVGYVPRGIAHRAEGPERDAAMLVIERLAPPQALAAAPTTQPAVLDLPGASGKPTPAWTRSGRPLLSSPSFVVEAHARPEGMLEPFVRLESPEAWVVLRGAIAVEVDRGAPQGPFAAGQVVTLPAACEVRVLSVRPDTRALRVRRP
ncbi:MAG TPA: hypothetical protein VND21_12035 [Planctomycetota bacterium]|nr:hypothetical protein [Planctomycetota bacterium]